MNAGVMPLRLHIATFNLEDLGEPSAAGPSLAQRAQVLRPQLERLDADLLCLQEVNAQDLPGRHDRALTILDRVLNGTPYASYQRIATRGPGGEHPADKHNLVVLSRWPIATSRQIQHDFLPPLSYSPVTADPAARQPLTVHFDRPFLHAAISPPNGRRVHVVNLHLKAPLAVPIPGQKHSAFKWKTISGWAEGFYLASLKRAGQALEARLFIDRLFDDDPDALIAVCGDFNAECHEVPVRTILGNEDDTGNAALASRVLSALDDLVPQERRYSVIHAGRRVTLDHIFASRALRETCRGATIFNEGLADEAVSFATGFRPLGSFHAPMVAEFSLSD